MNGKKVVLVGGCGFIGHNLAIYLKKNNFDVSIVDSLSVNNILNFNNSEIKNRKLYKSILDNRIEILNKEKIELIIQDARDYNSMSRMMGQIKPNIIIHLAAISHANVANKDPHNTFDHSLRTLENSLDIARISKIHLIYVSSSMVYGDFKDGFVDENSDCNPVGIYGTLKLAGELMVKSYNQVYDLPFTIIRPSALYGERCVSRRVGQILIENALENKEIAIHGDGSEKLDFTYIEDLIHGIYLCCLEANGKNKTFNITYGQSRTIKELISVLEKKFSNLKIVYKEKEKFVPTRGTLINKNAKELLKYSPQFPIEKGYIKYIDWYIDFYKKFNDKNK